MDTLVEPLRKAVNEQVATLFNKEEGFDNIDDARINVHRVANNVGLEVYIESIPFIHIWWYKDEKVTAGNGWDAEIDAYATKIKNLIAEERAKPESERAI